MPYTPQTWTDGVSSASAARMTVIENGIAAAVPKDVTTTKGDLLAASAAATVGRLGVGANGQVLTADSAQTLGVKWATSSSGLYRKSTVKTVNTTVAATDLLNAEITVAAGALTSTGVLRFKAFGDWLHNGGANSAPPRFQLLLGGTTLFDTGTSGAITSGTNRAAWTVNATVSAMNATNSQQSYLDFVINAINAQTTQVGNTFTTPSTSGAMTSVNIATNFTIISGSGVNSSALDMTTSKTLVLNATLATNSATEEIRLFGALVEIL